jgi:hypothetical protein
VEVSKPHYQIRLYSQARLDLTAWCDFIDHFNGKSLFLDEVWQTSDKLHLYTDAAGSLGYGAVFGTECFYGHWEEIIGGKEHSITWKELFPVVVAIETWGISLANKSILFHSDNLSVVHIINKILSKDASIMRLVRRLVLACLHYNILFKAEHISGITNTLPDLLSRLQVAKFQELAPHMDRLPTVIPTKFLST